MVALPDPAVAGVRPNVLLHAGVGLLLLGQLTVQLGYFMLSGFLLKAVVTRDAALFFVMRSAIRLLSLDRAA